MTIIVRYFASLRERVGRGEERLAPGAIATVGDAWNAANPGMQVPDNILAAVNMEYAGFDAPVKDGDEVAFFPPVTGG
jgi:molybdopterin synthase sulfur carrier subunit